MQRRLPMMTEALKTTSFYRPEQPQPMNIRAAGVTDVGDQRRRNEDSFCALEAQRLFAVADGLGGYAYGDVASKLAVDTLTECFDELAGGHSSLPARLSSRPLLYGIQLANRRIVATGRGERFKLG